VNEPLPAGACSLPLARGLPLFTLLVVLGNIAGSALRYPEIGAAVLFPPYAVLTAAVVVSRRSEWPWYVLIGAAAHFATHWPQWTASWVLGADVANVARALCAAALLRRLLPDRPRLDGIGALMLFALSAVLVAPALGATIGAANVVLHGASPDFLRPWTAWFLSNALTGLTMLPACLLLFASLGQWPSGRPDPRRVGEALAIAAALGVSCAIAFHVRDAGEWPPAVLRCYAPLPVLIWAALRFGTGAASLALTVVAFAGILGADRSAGPFRSSSRDDSVLALQVFLLLTSLPVLCIAAVNAARQGVAELHRALLASLHDQVAILDARGVVIEVNDSWRRAAGGAAANLMDRAKPGDGFPEACGTSAAQGDAIAARALAGVTSVLGRQQRRFEMEYDHEGRPEAFALTVEALERPDGGAVVVRSDVTARRQAQLEIEEQRRELSHLARVAVLGQLSGALAHELNQPLAAILTNADAARHLLDRQPPDLAEVRAILHDIAHDDRRAAEVIGRLRGLFKRGNARPQPVEVRELVDEVLQLAHSELISQRVSATTAIADGLRPVLADRVQLQQVLLNLILNACEAMNGNARELRTVQLAVSAHDGAAHFSVRDHGTGISPDVLERLFEPFVTTKPEGLGLGLSISHTIIAGHGGRMWAENNPDRGATFHCVVPFSA